MAIDIGTGTTLTLGTSSWTAEILNVDWDGIERPAIDSTNMSTTTARTFIPGDLYDPGSVTFEVQHDPADCAPIGAAAETLSVDWAGSTNTWSVTAAFITAYSAIGPLEGMMTATVTFKVSGTITM